MGDATPGGKPDPRVGELDRVKQEYTKAAREILAEVDAGRREDEADPGHAHLAGVTLCLAGAVLVGFEQRNEYLFFWLGGVLFVIGSIADILDGALARAASKGTVFGALPRLELRPRRRGGDAGRDRPRRSCTTATRSRSCSRSPQ